MKKITVLILINLLTITGFRSENMFLKSNPQEHFYEIKSGAVVMKISSKGGRVISYKIGNKEIITSKKEHENYGSTLWPAPQRDWGWPPYAILDEHEYTVEKKGNMLKMTSSPDPKSGFQFEKRWELINSNCIRIIYTIRNISKDEKKVGPWEVTRVPCGGLVLFPDGGEGKGKVPYSSLKISLQKDGINWILIDKYPIDDHQKSFSTAMEGWLSYVVEDVLFIKRFPDIRPEDYSPDQGEVEIYVDKEKSYIELENYGAYQSLDPGKSLEYVVDWYLFKLPKTIKPQMGNSQLVKMVREKLAEIE